MPFRDRRREQAIARLRHRLERTDARCHFRGTRLRQFRYTPMPHTRSPSIRELTFFPAETAVLCATRQDFFLRCSGKNPEERRGRHRRRRVVRGVASRARKSVSAARAERVIMPLVSVQARRCVSIAAAIEQACRDRQRGRRIRVRQAARACRRTLRAAAARQA
ncbi:MAG TPA: hypothetical protein VMR06_05940 [Dokdonella sp.]|uniref:hypothetical protein n=1 Tax=Dokdonella sp. TaxID=2291710 RepID=UPI002C48C282|nr:hypothetical protein [Dokdonella sp.]HUD41526.1 hypothetical protein [Dokdonella sp.]